MMNHSNLKELNQYLKNIQLNPESLDNAEFPHSELFWLKTNEQELGLFWMFDLKDLLQKQTPFDGELFICPFLDENKVSWEALFDHPFFQRRKEGEHQEFLKDQIELTAFYTLENGQKVGPFKFEDIKERISVKDILMTDLISLDQGKTWIKVFQVKEFDRREMPQHELPYRPEQSDDMDSTLEKLKNKWIQKKDSDTQIIAGLAYVENVRSGKIKNKTDEITKTPEPLKSSSSFVKYFYGGVFCFSVFGISFLLLTGDKTDNTSLNPTAESQQREPAPELTPSETFEPRSRRDQAENQRETASQEQKAKEQREARLRPTRPSVGERESSREDQSFSRDSTPFRETDTYRRAQRQRREREQGRNMRTRADIQVIANQREDLYYDDARGSLELDPVRETLSRDVIDPVDDYGDYYYDNEYDNSSRRPASRSGRTNSFPPSDDYDSQFDDAYDQFEETYDY